MQQLKLEDLLKASNRKALFTFLLSFTFFASGILSFFFFPWYLLPVSWIYLGIVASGLYSIGKDCSENKFWNTETLPIWVNRVTGWIVMLPILYSFENFKVFLKSDPQDESDDEELLMVHKLLRPVVVSPFWFLSSTFEWIYANIYTTILSLSLQISLIKVIIPLPSLKQVHQKLLDIATNNRKRIVLLFICLNSLVVYGFCLLAIGLILYFIGLLGIVKYYLGPLIVYHIVMSIFLKVNVTTIQDVKHIYVFPLLIERLSNYCNHYYSIGIENRINIASASDQDLLLLLRNAIMENTIPSYNIAAAKEYFKDKLNEASSKGNKPMDIQMIRLNFKMVKQLLLQNNFPEIDFITLLYYIASVFVSILAPILFTFPKETWYFALVGFILGSLSLSAGYHRLFAHKSYEAHWIIQWMFALLGTSTCNGSILKWVSNHRLHHRFIDTPKDPHTIQRGLFFSHLGWLIYKKSRQSIWLDDCYLVDELKQNLFLQLQHIFYYPLALFMGYVAPMLIAGLLWNDYLGGLLICGVLAKTLLQHSNYLINSAGHCYGERPFDEKKSCRDEPLLSWLTFGEGCQNFHHTFPYDYRNGVQRTNFDPSKWFIFVLECFGLAWNLKRCDEKLYHMTLLQTRETQLKRWQKELDEQKQQWLPNACPNDDTLPTITENQVKERCCHGKEKLVVIEDVVYDVTEFLEKNRHPGGQNILETFVGHDASKAFHGTIHSHSSAAKILMHSFRKYRLQK